MSEESLVASFLQDEGLPHETYPSLGVAVHHFLRRENKNKVLPWVEECQELAVKPLYLATVFHGSPKHYARVEPREPLSPTGNTTIAGIVVLRRSLLKLVDGYHRFKWLTEAGEVKGLYIILSREPFEEALAELSSEALEANRPLWF